MLKPFDEMILGDFIANIFFDMSPVIPENSYPYGRIGKVGYWKTLYHERRGASTLIWYAKVMYHLSS